MLKLKHIDIFNPLSKLSALPLKKLLISTINAHSYNLAQEDSLFEEALKKSDVLLPDGISIVWALRWLVHRKIVKISGWDLFCFEMERLNKRGGICFFLGSTENVLSKIKDKALNDYPNIKVCVYSPPYKPEFSKEDNKSMIDKINQYSPDLLWVGMTAPKQEKWAYQHFQELHVKGPIGCIGAVFDFYAGTVKRAPQWMINCGLEWFYRLCKEPTRLWKRYIIGNTLFIYSIVKEKLSKC